MSQLLVRDLDDEIVEALRQRATANGRCMEAEHREILRAHLTRIPKRKSLKAVLAEMPYFEDDYLFDMR
jgi:plasmid stability protein